MAISVGDTLPEASFLENQGDAIIRISLNERIKGQKVVIVAMPGAFTNTCTTAHIPSFVRNADALRAKGVDEIICISVNDPYVMKAWGETTGATKAGISFLADSDGAYTREIGMNFDAPGVGLHNRSLRYAMIVDDGKVTFMNLEEKRGVCELTSGEALLEELG